MKAAVSSIPKQNAANAQQSKLKVGVGINPTSLKSFKQLKQYSYVLKWLNNVSNSG
jgi:hypothetical protein